MKKRTKKTQLKREQEREGLGSFFIARVKHIKKTQAKCQECGAPLKGDISEVAHILPKQKFKSIMRNPKNVLYLCGYWSSNGCHTKFDNCTNAEFKKMNVFAYVKSIVEELFEEAEEKPNYKTLDRYL